MLKTSTSTVILAFLALAASSGASAATFSVLCDGFIQSAHSTCIIKLTGLIEPGDEHRFREIIRKPLLGAWHYDTLLLDSPDGDVSEALRLATLVREAMLSTSTQRFDFVATTPGSTSIPRRVLREHWPCVSACFLVWVAGTERKSRSTVLPQHGNVGIGLHRPSFAQSVYSQPPSKVAELQQAMTASVREYLRREQVPEFFIDKMLERSSLEVYWLNESGDEYALNGRAAWFEEMMIARCNFDPAYDSESSRRSAKRTAEIFEKRRPVEDIFTNDTAGEQYIKWRQTFERCKAQVRFQAQVGLRNLR